MYKTIILTFVDEGNGWERYGNVKAMVGETEEEVEQQFDPQWLNIHKLTLEEAKKLKKDLKDAIKDYEKEVTNESKCTDEEHD